MRDMLALIQSGARTHTHDHEIFPRSLRVMKIRVRAPPNVMLEVVRMVVVLLFIVLLLSVCRVSFLLLYLLYQILNYLSN